MDINEIKAGEYQLVAERWDERTSKPGEPFTFVRHRRGDLVELSEEDARRLVFGGAAVKPGELERRAAEAARRQYLALLAQMPDGLRRELRAQDAAEAVVDLEGQALADAADGPPKKAEAKPLWVAWAIRCGADPEWADAESTTKQELIDQYATATPVADESTGA